MVKKVCGDGDRARAFALLDGRARAIDGDIGLDLRHARGVALDGEALRHVTVGGAQCRLERHWRSAIGELEVGLQGQRAALGRDGVVFFANGLLELVQAEFAGFSLRSGLGDQDGRRKGEQQQTGATKTIHAVRLLRSIETNDYTTLNVIEKLMVPWSLIIQSKSGRCAFKASLCRLQPIFHSGRDLWERCAIVSSS